MRGFVDTVFLKGCVSPSQIIRDDPHKVWVCLENDCRILTSWCTCTAGTSEVCNHVIALMYKVNFAYKKTYIPPACTSVPQGWVKGTKRDVEPKQMKNLVFRKDKKKKQKRTMQEMIWTI